MELPGQRGSDCGAHVTEEAVEEQGHFTRSLPATSAPLVHDPWPDYRDYYSKGHLTGIKTEGWGGGATYRRHERRRSSADRELRPTGTQRLSASRDKQVETESTQNSAKPDSQALGSAVAAVPLSMRGVTAFTLTPRNGGAGSTCKLILHASSRISWWMLWEELTCETRLK